MLSTSVTLTFVAYRYFGEPEESVIAFTVEHLSLRVGAKDMATVLRPLLVDDCDDFVFKMWRMLIFEMLSAKDSAT